MESNVVLFPRSKRNHPPQSMDEVIESVIATRKEHIEIFLENVLPFVFSNAADYGLDLSKEECAKPTALFVESLKAALYSTCEIEHPLQNFAENSFSFIDEEFTILTKDPTYEPENSVDFIKE
jgi:hypothetical protein